MSLPARVLAASGALLLLAGCRHKSTPAAKPAPVSAPPSAAAQPPAEADPLTPLRPHLAEALSKVRTAAGPLGLLGWPGVAALDGPDESNPTLERLFFDNDRALIFANKATGGYSAMVLMPESKSTDELHYRLVQVRDLFGSPTLKEVHFPSPGMKDCTGNDGIEWRGSDTIAWGGYPSKSALRIFPDEPFRLIVGPRESDNTAMYLASTTPLLQNWVDELTNEQSNLEGVHESSEAEFAQTLPRKDFQAAIKRGESKRFVWFEVNGVSYAAEKTQWELWMKGPRPSVIKDPAP